MAELDLQHVTKYYGDVLAVDDLSLSIERGEFVCLLGSSGCGKTTTLRMIAGFESIDAGMITLGGEDVTALPPQRRDIGLVFQQYALFPHMTVAENVAFGLKMRRLGRARIDAEVAEALTLVRIEGLAERYPRQLSGGQQQRVALARALTIRPRLLLMDEPLSNLDAKLRDEMRDEIRRIQKTTGITAVFVTHDQTEALALADRVAVMEKGKLLQIADPLSIYERPTSVAVDRFIGQVNALNGTIVEVKGDLARVTVEGGFEVTGVVVDRRRGDRVLAMVKQERIVLTRQRPASADNILPCIVEAQTYLGPVILYQCRANGQKLSVIVPNHPSLDRFAVGESGFAHWSSRDCRVFDN